MQDEKGKQEMWWRRSLKWYKGSPSQEQIWLPCSTPISSLAVGAVEPQEEDAGGELLHDFLDKCDLMGANTFDGTGRRTWVPTRGQEARIDYVVCP